MSKSRAPVAIDPMMAATTTDSEMLEARRVFLRIPRWFGLVSGVAALAVFALLPHVGWPLAVYTVLILTGSLTLAFAYRLPPRERTVRIQANRDGIREGGRMLIRRSDVRNATIAEIAGGGVVLTFRGVLRTVAFRMGSAEEAGRIMAKLQVLPSSRAMVFARGMPTWLTPLVIVLGAMIAIAAHRPLNTAHFMALLSAIGVGFWWSNTITVGREGIRIASLFLSRFIGYGDIEEVVDEVRAIVIRLRGGKTLRVTSMGIATPYTKETGNRHIVHHILFAKQALEESRRSASTVTPAAMAAVGAGHTPHYRVSAVPREHLLATAEDPAADVKLRIAAIQALSSDADVDERARLETIAEASASPLLRMAIKRTE